MRSLIFGLALSLASAGCGADARVDLPREGDIVQRAEVCVALYDAVCLYLFDCGLVTVSERGVCETNFFDACCTLDDLCGQQVQLKKGLAPCLSDLDSQTCPATIGEAPFPVTCEDLIQ